MKKVDKAVTKARANDNAVVAGNGEVIEYNEYGGGGSVTYAEMIADLDKKFGSRFDEISGSVKNVADRLGKTDKKVDGVARGLSEVDDRVKSLEKKYSEIDKKLEDLPKQQPASQPMATPTSAAVASVPTVAPAPVVVTPDTAPVAAETQDDGPNIMAHLNIAKFGDVCELFSAYNGLTAAANKIGLGVNITL